MVRRYPCVLGFLALSIVSVGGRHVGCGQGEASRESHELRGRADDQEGCGSPGSGPKKDKAGSKEEKAKHEEAEKKKQKLKKDITGSPTNEKMQTIEEAITTNTKVGQVFLTWPLSLRLVIVGVILSMPLMIIACSMWLTPVERLSSSVYVKTSLHCGFAFAVGWINCIMLLRYRVFATMMVGNTILMGVAFVCNGGLSTAHDKEAWWMGEHARVLCPAEFESASHYLLMIFLFLFGAFVQGFLNKKFAWTSRGFAPIIAAGIIIVEMLEYFGVVQDSRMDVYLLSPIFGMFVSISAHCGVGSVPWAATGHMTSMAYKFASVASGLSDGKVAWPELQTATVNLCLWCSFVAGIMLGTLFHSNRTVMLNALYLQGILIFNGVIYNAELAGKSVGTTSNECYIINDAPNNASVGDGDSGEAKQNYSSCQMPKTSSQARLG